MMFEVITIGHVLMDLRFCVDDFATPDKESVILRQSRGVGGSAANVAIGIQRLGGSSSVIGKIGFDEFGKAALEDLAREGVDVSNVRIEVLRGRTGFTIVIINSKGDIIMYGYKGVADELLPKEVNPAILEKAKFVHIARLRLDTSIHVARMAKDMGLIVSWDPGRILASLSINKLRPMIELSDIILPNEKEALEMTGMGNYKDAGKALMKAGAHTVIIKRGSKGAYVVTKDSEVHIPAYHPEKVVDTTGAGDAFVAGLLTALRKGYEIKDAVRYAVIVAGIKVSRLGSHEIPTEKEVEDIIAELKE